MAIDVSKAVGRLWAPTLQGIERYLAQLPPWVVLDELGAILEALGEELSADYCETTPGVWVHRTATVAADAVLQPPCLIDVGAEVRPGAYLRGNVYVGKGAVAGHASELKNSILLAGAAAPHFNYVGDSILGHRAHLGAGVILSNLRLDEVPVWVQIEGARYPTGRRKLGALVGDNAQVGCNAVLNPGTVLAAGARVPPLASVRGYVKPAD